MIVSETSPDMTSTSLHVSRDPPPTPLKEKSVGMVAGVGEREHSYRSVESLAEAVQVARA